MQKMALITNLPTYVIRHLKVLNIILKWVFKRWDGGHGLDLSGSG
jgi:hypothetical protein